MSVLLFRLNNVPEEEAEGVRAVLEAAEIEFYETSAGAFGISVAAIWLQDEAQLARARQLIDEFQLEHRERSQQDYRDRLARGEAETFWARSKREPLKVLAVLIAVGVILYVSIVPWLSAWD